MVKNDILVGSICPFAKRAGLGQYSPVFLAMIGTVHSSQALKTVITAVSVKTIKHITVDERNYLTLKRLGSSGDSFNDVISRLLKKSTTTREPEEEGTE